MATDITNPRKPTSWIMPANVTRTHDSSLFNPRPSLFETTKKVWIYKTAFQQGIGQKLLSLKLWPVRVNFARSSSISRFHKHWLARRDALLGASFIIGTTSPRSKFAVRIQVTSHSIGGNLKWTKDMLQIRLSPGLRRNHNLSLSASRLTIPRWAVVIGSRKSQVRCFGLPRTSQLQPLMKTKRWSKIKHLQEADGCWRFIRQGTRPQLFGWIRVIHHYFMAKTHFNKVP